MHIQELQRIYDLRKKWRRKYNFDFTWHNHKLEPTYKKVSFEIHFELRQ